MKSFEYIKNLLEERKHGYEQILANPEAYDTKTLEYAKSLYEETLKWYNERLKDETEV